MLDDVLTSSLIAIVGTGQRVEVVEPVEKLDLFEISPPTRLDQQPFQRVPRDLYPAIVDVWRRNWERFTPFLEFNAAIRKIIYTTNAVESLNYQLRKVTKTRGHFPTDDAVLKILYLAIRNIGNNRGGHLCAGTPSWKQALNAFAIAFPGRLYPTTRIRNLTQQP